MKKCLKYLKTEVYNIYSPFQVVSSLQAFIDFIMLFSKLCDIQSTTYACAYFAVSHDFQGKAFLRYSNEGM